MFFQHFHFNSCVCVLQVACDNFIATRIQTWSVNLLNTIFSKQWPCDLVPDLDLVPFAHLHTYLDVTVKFCGNWIWNSGRKPSEINLLTDTWTDKLTAKSM